MTARFKDTYDRSEADTPWIATLLFALASNTPLAAGTAVAWYSGRFLSALQPLAIAALLTSSGLAAIVLARWLHPIRPILATGMLAGITLANLLIANGPNPSSARPPEAYDVLRADTENATIRELKRRVAEGLRSTRRDRIELVGLGPRWSNASATHELDNTLGAIPFRLKTYEEATAPGDTAGMAGPRKLRGITSSYHSKMADLLGIRFITSATEIADIDPNLTVGDFFLVLRTPEAIIYENPRALPRVFYASEAYHDDFDAWQELAENCADFGFHVSGVVFRRTLLLHKRGARLTWPLQPPALPGPPRSIRIVSHANTQVVIEADGPGGNVVLNDVWHPWWVASVNGQGAAVERANFLFHAVAVPPGRHTVRFTFVPITGAIGDMRARPTSGSPDLER